MKKFFFIFFICQFIYTNAQIVNEVATFSDTTKSLENEHTAVKASFQSIDSTSLIYSSHSKFKLSLNPAFDFQIGHQNKEEATTYRYGYGVNLRLSRKKWNAGFTFLQTNGKYMYYRDQFIDKYKVLPATNVARGIEQIRSDYLSAFLNYKANDIFTFELGYGRNFIGDGYRSLLLSDFANASPYLKIRTNFWKIEYTNIFAAHQDIYQVEGFQDLYQKKYSASHFLDYKVNKWLTIGLFESVIWQANEKNYRRGFDVNYLNPVIFYRPVEFSIGSSDNVLVGANIKISPVKNHQFYFQLLLDEFLLDEMKADVKQWVNPDEDIRSAWWANKYGFQAGWKAFHFMKVKGLSTQVEFNLVRPFTYAHSNPTQSYTNYNLSLAHPLGANFYEFISKLNYQGSKWIYQIQFNQSKQGQSQTLQNLGENILLSNRSRTKEYENSITQGINVQVRYFETSVAYPIKKAWNAYLSIGYVWREEKSVAHIDVNNMVYLRFNTKLYNQYFDF